MSLGGKQGVAQLQSKVLAQPPGPPRAGCDGRRSRSSRRHPKPGDHGSVSNSSTSRAPERTVRPPMPRGFGVVSVVGPVLHPPRCPGARGGHALWASGGTDCWGDGRCAWCPRAAKAGHLRVGDMRSARAVNVGVHALLRPQREGGLPEPSPRSRYALPAQTKSYVPSASVTPMMRSCSMNT